MAGGGTAVEGASGIGRILRRGSCVGAVPVDGELAGWAWTPPGRGIGVWPGRGTGVPLRFGSVFPGAPGAGALAPGRPGVLGAGVAAATVAWSNSTRPVSLPFFKKATDFAGIDASSTEISETPSSLG